MSYSLPVGYLLQGKSYVYKIEKVLGQGAFGITYLAGTRVRVSGALGEIETELRVAVKEFFMKDINGRCDSTVTCSSSGDLYVDYRRKFAREATNLSQLNHPHIVKVLELFEANNTYYYSMEYCEGGTLDALVKKQRGLDVQAALSYFRQIADALSFMHENRMLHLDLKPSNIMLRGNGEAVLIDFGLSKQYTASGDPESSTRVGSGTPGYAPIEQANYREGKDFPVTMDVYALGGTLFKMLSGIRPPEASELLNEGFPAYELQQKGVCDELITCISRAMSPIRKSRYLSVRAFLQALPTLSSPQKHHAEDTGYQMGPSKHQDVLHPVHHLSNVSKEKNRIQRINGHDYVDLGLPSGLKWATCNVGASRPEDFGDLYAWGEIKINSGPISAIWGENDINKPSDISGNIKFDVARAQWGNVWRMPSKTDFEELRDNCKWKWISLENHNGYIVIGPNGKSIFLPAAGCKSYNNIYKGIGHYWSSTSSAIDDEFKMMKMELFFKESEYSIRFNTGYSEFSIRPVIDLTRKRINSDSEINNDTIVATIDQFKQVMTLEGQQKVNAKQLEDKGELGLGGYLFYLVIPVNPIYSIIVYLRMNPSTISLIGFILSIIQIVSIIVFSKSNSTFSFILWILSLGISFVLSTIALFNSF